MLDIQNALEFFGRIALDITGKECLGSVMLQDSNSRLWKVKVRFMDGRGRYLKIESKLNGSQTLRASADGYKPEKYLRITPSEWYVFVRLESGESNSELHDRAQNILDRLV